ncbi:hypothetical protein GQ43DRAFT_220720 [Delitschia confertaspora ATCC 74209]|uniref:CHY-type domain-containing protein n=1 Tax=Delitschia confertaspora ATCC 74209 TaxID=1513339 RepID=A0A9P4JI68_9PLEO|nr:hypothetical protein GQ43DRAFT_220720 [Delitschia confertaspora ATCC 74209]
MSEFISLKSSNSPEPSSHSPIVHGIDLTPLTQCTHYSSPLDIIAIKHACCNRFYACIKCHNELETSHEPRVWKEEQWDEKVVLCGKCKRVWSADEYMGCGSACPGCGGNFNPGCKGHWGLYFKV